MKGVENSMKSIGNSMESSIENLLRCSRERLTCYKDVFKKTILAL